MSMAEKKAMLGLMTVSSMAGIWFLVNGSKNNTLTKGNPLKKDQVITTRENLLKEKDIKMLYSTMTFFYL